MARPTTTPKRSRGLRRPLHIARSHGRLLMSFAISIATFLALTGMAHLPTRILIGWNTGVAVYLALTLIGIARFDIKRVRQRAAAQDDGAVAMLVLTVAAALASIAAIVAFLGGSEAGAATQGVNFALAAVTIVLSWCMIHTIFALHYAHEFYGAGADRKFGGLAFPHDARPDYWDFIYFAFVIGMTFQVSDVQVTSKALRRLVVAHGIVSFLFSVAILALAVNIGSSLIRG